MECACNWWTRRFYYRGRLFRCNAHRRCVSCLLTAIRQLYNQAASGSPTELRLTPLLLPDSKTHSLTVFGGMTYVLTLVNSVTGVAVLCEGGAQIRILAAVVLFCGGVWLCTMRRSKDDLFWGSVTYLDVLISHLLASSYCAVYFVECAVADMSWVSWIALPIYFPLLLIGYVADELMNQSEELSAKPCSAMI